jgi:hypothetical protein
MTTYVVRVEESKEFVGIYAASNEPELFWLVDQLTDPYICEYARLNFGGICFAGACSRFVSLDEMTEKEIEWGHELNEPRFTEEMIEFKGRWKPITKDCYPKRDGTDD